MACHSIALGWMVAAIRSTTCQAGVCQPGSIVTPDRVTAFSGMGSLLVLSLTHLAASPTPVGVIVVTSSDIIGQERRQRIEVSGLGSQAKSINYRRRLWRRIIFAPVSVDCGPSTRRPSEHPFPIAT